MQTFGLALAAVLVAVTACFAVVINTPLPEPTSTSIREVVSALKSPQDAERLRFRTAMLDVPPKGRASSLLASSIAEELGVPSERVRAIWEGNVPASVPAEAEGQALITIAGQDVVVDTQPNGFVLGSGVMARLSVDTKLPSFHAAVRAADGRWRVLRPPNSALAAWRRAVSLAFTLSVLAITPVAWWLARRFTRPMRMLAEAANQMQMGARTAALPSAGPAEVRDVCGAMNAMRERLAQQALERTKILAAIAHDLRNPLTSLRIRAEAAPPELRQHLISDLDRMVNMIAEVLDYSQSTCGTAPFEAVDLISLIDDCVAHAQSQSSKVSWVAPATTVIVTGNYTGLRRAIDNVLDNALRYGGSAELGAQRLTNGAVVTIRDLGPGILEAEVPRLLRPFERMEPSRSRDTGGTGLGLAIACDIVSAHGGQLRLSHPEGGGLLVEIELPSNSEH